ncbi:NusG domain II-containing protein [Paenibacillus sp. N3/727]|uniref:NusG domain II-containing protein n=1 Tax=Paenibacillus sp. N3/727 TaxID=2925845 RepID=UPI001F5311BA|nr:NusG domain II-containing protein [Paenibacillus sp. N3/727]UNK19081.1 NusG domain II-containing protein [Paenibacillus sp. N3/727]
MKRGDLVLISVVLAAALIFLVPRWLDGKDSEKNHNNPLTATITVDGQLFKTVELTEEEQIIEIKTDHGMNILKVYDYGIEMIEADCPDKVCLSFGFVDKKNQSIVCLPHKVLVEVEGASGGESQDEVDAVVN